MGNFHDNLKEKIDNINFKERPLLKCKIFY
jgi:hypothetical protein